MKSSILVVQLMSDSTFISLYDEQLNNVSSGAECTKSIMNLTEIVMHSFSSVLPLIYGLYAQTILEDVSS